jgi:hypothetical protein
VLIAGFLSACSRPDEKLGERIKADLNAMVPKDCSLRKCVDACKVSAGALSLTVECRVPPSDGIDVKKYLTNKCAAMKEVGLDDAELNLTSPENGDMHKWTAEELQAGNCSFKQVY